MSSRVEETRTVPAPTRCSVGPPCWLYIGGVLVHLGLSSAPYLGTGTRRVAREAAQPGSCGWSSMSHDTFTEITPLDGFLLAQLMACYQRGVVRDTAAILLTATTKATVIITVISWPSNDFPSPMHRKSQKLYSGHKVICNQLSFPSFLILSLPPLFFLPQ